MLLRGLLATIQPACLPTLATTDAAVSGWPFSVVGWGKTQNSTTISPVLNQLGYFLLCFFRAFAIG